MSQILVECTRDVTVATLYMDRAIGCLNMKIRTKRRKLLRIPVPALRCLDRYGVK